MGTKIWMELAEHLDLQEVAFNEGIEGQQKLARWAEVFLTQAVFLKIPDYKASLRKQELAGFPDLFFRKLSLTWVSRMGTRGAEWTWPWLGAVAHTCNPPSLLRRLEQKNPKVKMSLGNWGPVSESKGLEMWYSSSWVQSPLLPSMPKINK